MHQPDVARVARLVRRRNQADSLGAALGNVLVLELLRPRQAEAFLGGADREARLKHS